MPLQIIRATPDHAPQIARILFEGFKGISERHAFPLDIPSLEVANFLTGMLTQRPDVYGVVAIENGKIIGSNFTQVSDEVSGVGPITVDPACQSRGVGRALMQHVIDWSQKNHGPMVRLLQDAFNMTSLSLYASLGFTVVEPVALMAIQPAAEADESVRPLTADDLPQCDALGTKVIKVSRKNELAGMVAQGAQMGVVPHGRFRAGKLVAYVVPGFFGHGVGETVDDLLSTAMAAARSSEAHLHKIILPVSNGPLFREALKRQMRAIKVMQLMALGPYEQAMPPQTGAAWSPSIAY